MQRKMTITIDEAVYAGLHKVIGRGNISQFWRVWLALMCLKKTRWTRVTRPWRQMLSVKLQLGLT